MRSLILLFVASTRALEMPYLAAATMAPKCRLIFNRSSRKAGIRHSVFCVQLPGLLRGSKGTVLAQRENHCPALRLFRERRAQCDQDPGRAWFRPQSTHQAIRQRRSLAPEQ